jgi:peptide chain release factor 2
VAGIEPEEQLKELGSTLSSIEQVLDLDAMRRDIAELREQSADPDLWSDQERAQAVTRRLSYLESELNRVEGLRQRLDDAATLYEMAREMDDADTRTEADEELAALHKAVQQLEVRTLMSGAYDAREALVTINAQAGGVDAADWAQQLQRMYLRWAERHGYPTEIYDTSYAEEAGIKSTTFAVKAPYAYGTLRGEHGTHRLIRISPFDNQGRRQTSFAGLDVVPVVEQSDHVEIDESELRIDVYRSSGPGGQGVNTTDSAVRITHPERHRRLLPERAQPAPEQGHGDERPAGQAAGAQAQGGGGGALRAARRGHHELGHADPQLRAAPVQDRQGPAHRRRGRQHLRGPGRRHRRVHRGRDPLAAPAGERLTRDRAPSGPPSFPADFRVRRVIT